MKEHRWRPVYLALMLLLTLSVSLPIWAHACGGHSGSDGGQHMGYYGGQTGPYYPGVPGPTGQGPVDPNLSGPLPQGSPRQMGPGTPAPGQKNPGTGSPGHMGQSGHMGTQ